MAIPPAPSMPVIPVISIVGTRAAGQVLTAVARGDIIVGAYQWMRSTNGTPAVIPGATSSTYTQVPADIGAGILIAVMVSDLTSISALR